MARTGAASTSRGSRNAQTKARGKEMPDGVRVVDGAQETTSFRECIGALKAAQRECPPGRALDALLIALWPAALNALRRYVPPPRDEDLAQELLLWVSKVYRQIRPEGSPRYLVTAAYNLARREHKGYPPGAVLLTMSAEPLDACRNLVAAESPADAFETAECLHMIHRAVFALPTTELRDVAIGIYVLDWEPAALAVSLGITYEALRQRLKRARRALQSSLAGLRPEVPGGAAARTRRGTRAAPADAEASSSRTSNEAPPAGGTA